MLSVARLKFRLKTRKAKEFVLEKYPIATAEKYRTKGFNKKNIWLIWLSKRDNRRIGQGDTESKAWKDAKEIIENS